MTEISRAAQVANLASEIVSVKDFGAVGDGVTDDTAAIQAALAEKGEIFFPSGTYKVTDTLQLDVATSRMVGSANTILDFSSSPANTVCIIMDGSVYPPYYQNANGIYNIQMFGNGQSGTHTGIKVETSPLNSGASSHINIENCNIYSFNIGIQYGTHAYLVRHNSTDVFRCGTCLYSDGTDEDMGENINFNGCTFYNSTKVLDVTQGSSGFDAHFTHCSFDFNDYIFYQINGCRVTCNQCHFEWRHEYKDSFFNLSGNGGVLNISNSEILGQDSAGKTADVIGTIQKGDALITNCHIHNLYSLGRPRDYLVENVGGRGTCTNNTFFDIDNISTGMFSDKLFNNNSLYISSDTAPITKVLTGANIILTPNVTDSSIFDVEKTFGSGSNSGFFVYIPSKGCSRLKVSVNFETSPIWTGDMFLTTSIGGQVSFNNEGLPRIVDLKTQGSITVNTATIGTTPIESYISTEQGTRSDYFVIQFNLNSVNTSGNVGSIKINACGI